MSEPARPDRSVTGRYRRPPAAWLWLALLLIPLIAALLAWFLRGDQTDEAVPPAPPATTPVTAPATTQATDGEPIQVDGTTDALTVTATVPDEQTRQSLLSDVREQAGDREVVDRITVTEGRPVTDFEGLPQVLGSAVGTFQEFGVRVEDEVITLTGTAPRQGDVQDLTRTAEQAFPGREVRTDLSAEAPVAETTLSCGALEDQIAQRLTDNPVNFELESANIDADSTARLTEIGEALAACNSSGIRVQGHTDATGPDAINDPLSQERAEAVRDVLVQAGVEAGDVTATGFAGEENVAPNDNPTAREQNRRVEIFVEDEGQ